MSAEPTTARSYGGWRRSRSLGMGRLDSRQTLLVVGCVLAPLLALAVGTPVSVVLALGAGGIAAAGLVLAQWRGVLLLDAALAYARWRWAALCGQSSYRGGVFVPLPRAWDLPGVLAPLMLLDVEEPGRGRVGVVYNQRNGLMSATLLLTPAGAVLADPDTVDRQVAGWGSLLAQLADDPLVRAASVTVESLPEPGTALADHVAGRLDPSAPQQARTVLAELAAAAPGGTARVAARLTLTVDPAAHSHDCTVVEATAMTLRSLGSLPVTAAGADVLRRATAVDVLAAVRCAFDPAARTAAPAAFADLTWSDAGPIAADEAFDHYRHDGAVSASWAMLAAPRQQVAHDVLVPLLTPGRFPRRVTLCYRVLSRAEAGALLERELNATAARAEYRRRTKRDPSARDTADQLRAAQAATEEAHGAGLVQFSVFVTTTAPSLELLPAARGEVEQAATRCRLQLRVAYGGQAAAFAVGLPCGIHPGLV